jgi:16S rRNA processing protein RimM
MLLVGVVRRPHGLVGEVSVEPLTSFPDRFRPGLQLAWQKEDELRTLRVSSVRSHGNRLLVTFEGVGSVDEARGLCGGELSVASTEAVPAPEGFYYSHELAGWRCEDRQGRLLGTVAGLEETTAGPLLEVDTPSKKGALVPFVEGILVTVDRDLRRVVIDPPDGLFDL